MQEKRTITLFYLFVFSFFSLIFVSSIFSVSERLILVVEAEHLDENRNFIEEVYREVKEKDNLWSPLIKNGEYVRVKFEHNLTSKNDIKVFPRIISGKPKIEVYEKDGKEIIAVFENMLSEEYNQVILYNLKQEQEIFDLKIVDGEIIFDYIVDPIIEFEKGAGDIGLAVLNSTTLVVVWANSSNDGIFFKIITANGTVLINPIKVDGLTDARRERVSVTALNTSAFSIGWYNITSADEMRETYSITGVSLTGKTRTDGAVGTNFFDNALTSLGQTRYAYCYIDRAENDADAYMVNGTTNSIIGTENTIDGAIGSATNGSNLFDCDAINTSSWAGIFYDDVDNDVTITTIDKDGTDIIAATDLDINVGEDSQVEVTSLDDNKFVALWFNGLTSQSNITATVRDTNNNIIKGLTIIVDNPGNWTSLATATMRNGSNGDFFAVIWVNSTNDGSQILGKVFNSSLDEITPSFIIDNNFHKRRDEGSSVLIHAVGGNIREVPSLCNGTFAVTYTNFSNVSIVKTFLINGSIWDGDCSDKIPPLITILSPLNQNYTFTTLDFFLYLLFLLTFLSNASLREEQDLNYLQDYSLLKSFCSSSL